MQKLTNTCWILSYEVNDYNQCGEYFVAAYATKPSKSTLSESLVDDSNDCLEINDTFMKHLLEGGGRTTKQENEWYILKEVPFGN